MKGQPAIEFLMTYSWAFVIIAIALVFLLAVTTITAPSTFSPAVCYISPGLTCQSAVILVNSINSIFAVEFINNLGQEISFPSNGVTFYPQFTSANYVGACFPTNAPAGSVIVCNTTLIPKKVGNIGQQFNPSFTISYQFCKGSTCPTITASNIIYTTGYTSIIISPFSSNLINKITLYSAIPGGNVVVDNVRYPSNTVLVFLGSTRHVIGAVPPSGYTFNGWITSGATVNTVTGTAFATSYSGSITANFQTSTTTTSSISTTTTSSTSTSSSSTSSSTTSSSTSSSTTTQSYSYHCNTGASDCPVISGNGDSYQTSWVCYGSSSTCGTSAACGSSAYTCTGSCYDGLEFASCGLTYPTSNCGGSATSCVNAWTCVMNTGLYCYSTNLGCGSTAYTCTGSCAATGGKYGGGFGYATAGDQCDSSLGGNTCTSTYGTGTTSCQLTTTSSSTTTSSTTTSSTTTIPWSISLTASPTIQPVGNYITLTATTNYTASSYNSITIFNATAGQWVGVCVSSPCVVNYELSYKAASVNYQAYVGTTSGLSTCTGSLACSSVVNVKWSPWSISLTSNVATQSIGNYVTLTATTNHTTFTNAGINIFNATSGTWIGTCVSTPCSISFVTRHTTGTVNYRAYVGNQSALGTCSGYACSSQVAVTWTNP